MATFKYISKDMSAKTIRGTLEADDRNDLVRKLKEQNLFLVSCFWFIFDSYFFYYGSKRR